MRTIRAEFSKATCEEAWERCYVPDIGVECCEYCHLGFGGMRPEYHHHIPTALGGDNSLENCRVICPPCHRRVTKEEDLPRIVKAKAILEKRAGLRRSKQKINSRGFEKWRTA
jgi:5-methylcytosine-specific restriction enzyme A